MFFSFTGNTGTTTVVVNLETIPIPDTTAAFAVMWWTLTFFDPRDKKLRTAKGGNAEVIEITQIDDMKLAAVKQVAEITRWHAATQAMSLGVKRVKHFTCSTN